MKNKLESISVFCGSSAGFDKVYRDTAYRLGTYLAEQEIALVYGGANLGLMRHLADGALDHGGEVIGVMPEFLRVKEVAYDKIAELIIVDTMHERKWKMSQISDAVIALPGGYGTLDEFFEMITWGQLSLHQKPVSLLNINGFFDDLLKFANRMVKEGFLKKENREMILMDHNIDSLIGKLKNYQAPNANKWIKNKLVHPV